MKNEREVPENKFILDATAGFRMMWFNKHHPNCLYIDQRPECEPDQVADWSKHLDFPNESFKLIVFDPPHILKQNNFGNYDNQMVRTYGILKADTIEQTIKNAFNEFFRLLKPYGILIFKWNTQYVSSDKLIALAPYPPLFFQISAHHEKTTSHIAKTAKTVWFCFMKIPEENQK